MIQFSVTVLGCGSALPTERHYGSSQVVNLHGRLFMVDCAEGTQFQFQRNHLQASKLDHIFITHLHPDHCLGLTGILSSYALKKRTNDLHVYAPAEFEEMLFQQFAFFVHHAQYQVVFHPISGTSSVTVFEDAQLRVTAFPLDHKVPCYGFLFQTPGRSYAYCSDTKAIDPPTEALLGVDLLYHEATYAEAESPLAEAMYHSTARQAARFAVQCHAKQLMIGHYSTRYPNESRLLAEAQEVFPNTILATENMTLTV